MECGCGGGRFASASDTEQLGEVQCPGGFKILRFKQAVDKSFEFTGAAVAYKRNGLAGRRQSSRKVEICPPDERGVTRAGAGSDAQVAKRRVDMVVYPVAARCTGKMPDLFHLGFEVIVGMNKGFVNFFGLG